MNNIESTENTLLETVIEDAKQRNTYFEIAAFQHPVFIFNSVLQFLGHTISQCYATKPVYPEEIEGILHKKC
jgi:3-hydroxyacyl-CoA dehydrogenase